MKMYRLSKKLRLECILVTRRVNGEKMNYTKYLTSVVSVTLTTPLTKKSCRAVAFLLESQGERQHPSTSAPTQSEFIYVGLE